MQNSVATSAALAIGVDLGGTHVLAVLMDRQGAILARQGQSLSAADRGSTPLIVGALVDCISSVHRQAPSTAPVLGVGVAVPGNVDPATSSTRYLPNFGWLEPVALGDAILGQLVDGVALRERLGVDRVHMRNDGRCAALAERHFGVGAGGEHAVLAMLTLGTGIGGALIHDPTPARKGALFDGCSFDAGDFGHHVLRSGADAFACVCGNHGCFECHASAAGLVRHWRAKGGDEAAISLDCAKDVVERMRAGEPTATGAWTAYRADLAAGLANLVTFYNPSLIVLGGGLSKTPELYDGLQAAVDGATLPATRGKVAIAQSALSSDCAAMGAAWLVFSEVDEEAVASPPAAAASASGGGGGGAIVCVGLTCMDSTVWVASQPVADTKVVAQRSLTCGGGNAANSAVAAARLRAPTDPPVRLVTKVGSDAHGAALIDELARDGVDTRWCVRAAAGGGATPTSVILVCGASRTIVHDPGLLLQSPLEASDFDGSGDGEWLAGAALLHLDGRHPAAALHAARAARAAGVPILLDVERPRPGLRELLPLVDYVVSSADYPGKLAVEDVEARDQGQLGLIAAENLIAAAEGRAWLPEELAMFVLEHCPNARWVCVTLGADGAVAVAADGEATRVPAWPLPAAAAGAIRDTTGAGDAFIGATAVGLARGLPLADTLRLASCVGAANCCADGARGGMPTRAQLPAEIRELLDRGR